MKNNKNLTFTFRCSHCNENNIFNFHDCDDKKKEETELFKNFSLEKLKRIYLTIIIATITLYAIVFAFVYFSSDFVIFFDKNFGFDSFSFLFVVLVFGGMLTILFAIVGFYEEQVRIAIKKEKKNKTKKKSIENMPNMKKPERFDADYFLENQMKNMLKWFDEAMEVVPEYSNFIKTTKEKILIECEALAERMEIQFHKDKDTHNGGLYRSIVPNSTLPPYRPSYILLNQKKIISEWFDRLKEDMCDFKNINLGLNEAREKTEKAKENILKEYDNLFNAFYGD